MPFYLVWGGGSPTKIDYSILQQKVGSLILTSPLEDLDKRDYKCQVDVEVHDGDLIVMGGACQRSHKHAIPASAKTHGRDSPFSSPGRLVSFSRSWYPVFGWFLKGNQEESNCFLFFWFTALKGNH